jgi:ribosomal protein S18 acetylase RimI-like enzyme
MDYLIRKVEPEDMPEIINLCAEHAEYELAPYSSRGKAKKLTSLLFAESANIFCLVATDKTKILGYATYMSELSTWDAVFYTHMDCLYLRPHARGFGIGEALIKEIARQSKANNCKSIQWQTPISNKRAIKFYHRLGATSKVKLRLYLSV